MLDRKPYTIEHIAPLAETDSRRAKKLTIRSAHDLRRREFPAIRYVVPGYIAEGCTILAGRPKLGKSWLVLDMGLAVATGSTCLGGIECEQGDVLYLALEDNERRLQKRIDKVLGPLHDWPESFEYATEWPRASDGGVEQIEEWILRPATRVSSSWTCSRCFARRAVGAITNTRLTTSPSNVAQEIGVGKQTGSGSH